MKNVCVVTGSRAEYGIMRTLLLKLNTEKSINLDVVVTAMHLEEKYGYTYKQIEEDGLNIVKKIPLELVNTSKKCVSRSLAILTEKLSDLFEENNYDLIIILGDRYEMLPVANIGLIYNIPICHIHGGEKTLGNFDESIRHAITKMSHLHLVASEEFKNRVLQLGEEEKTVHNIGAMGVENVLKQDFLSKRELEKTLGVELEEEYYVVLFHPVTLEDGEALSQINTLLKILNIQQKQSIFIGSNSDVDSDKIMDAVEGYIKQNPKSKLFKSLKPREYHSLVKYSRGLVGNSSSGLIEAPSLKTPTLNIGNRQLGRLRGPSVVDVNTDEESLKEGFKELEKITNFFNPYEQEDSIENAKRYILEYLEKNKGTVKDFKDLGGDK